VTAQLLDGAAVGAEVRAEVAKRVAELRPDGVTPGLGTILVGEDPASATYVGMKHRACEEAGMASVHEHLPADVSQADLLATIARFNADPAVDAYLVQLPLPKGLDEAEALLAVDPD
jgi:methylenetetrahydrofolate dehydrogenase (NADP+)/methenyltetrahydrofolate cyclohydrolase